MITQWLDYLLLPFSFGFMQRAIFIAMTTGVVCAIFSCILVLKGWSLMGDAISHAILPGIVVASVVGMPLAIGAFGSGLLCSILTGYIKDHSRVKEDTVMGILFSGMFALGLVLFSWVKPTQHLSHILFGNLLGITDDVMVQILGISALVALVLVLNFRTIMLYCFDPVQAQVLGLPVKWIYYSLLCLLALTIVAALQAVGSILVIAMLIAPGIIALTLCQRFNWMIIIAIIVSILSCLIGTLVSYYIDGATGPCIVITQAIFFVFAQIYQTIMIRSQTQ